jgi:hypothetical protein
MKKYTGIIPNSSAHCEGEFYAFFTRLGKRLYAGSHPGEELAALRHDEAQFLSRCWCSGRKPSYNDPDTFEKRGLRLPKTEWSEDFLNKAVKTLKVPLPEGFDPYYEPEEGESSPHATPPEMVKDLILQARASVRAAQRNLDTLLQLQGALQGGHETSAPAFPPTFKRVTPTVPEDAADAS